MCLVRKDSRTVGRNASVFRRVSVRTVGFLDGLRGALLFALQKENRRSASEAGRGEARDLFDELPDPPHLEYGEVRYRNGRFKYLDS